MKAPRSRRSPFDSPWARLIHPRRIGRVMRNWLLAVVAVVAFVDVVGEPMLRWDYRYRGSHSDPLILSANYVGFRGLRPARFEEAEKGYPILAFAKPETPLRRQLLDRAAALLP